MPRVKVDDVNIYYEVKGQGDPLIMVMGLAGNVDWWDPRMISELSKYFKLILFDNRGAGRSDMGQKPFSIKLFADDTAGLMNALGIPKANVLGFSMGGMIAQELVLNYPEKVKKLILCSTFCGTKRGILPPPQPFPIDDLEANPRRAAEFMAWTIFTEEFIRNNPQAFEGMVQRILKAPISKKAFLQQFYAIMQFDTYDRLPQIRVPTLIIHGKKDILLPVENASILASTIPNAKLIILENSGHGLAEEMDELITSIINFLRNSAH
ncbi:MAG: alpha/beta hydrolase [Candidatus Nezhaarchaeota archaeon]|nr:alpha/beta hydrolase [Candidatus Nezhaarchaeota archaeon]MCX8142330.1 alpha/beta hydrolase [Candidatus Nezhaarchaeota archaeon]